MAGSFDVLVGREFDVVSFGSNAVDTLITVASYPQFNSKAEFLSEQKMAGGEAASTAVGLRRLGMKAAYAGSFGDDEEGKIGIGSLNAEGVDTSYCRVVQGVRTQSAFIIIDRDSGERTVLWKRDDALNFPEGEAPVAIAAQASVLHLTPHDLNAAIAMANAARNAGTIVTIDIDSPVDGYERLLELVDVCIVSDQFLQKAFGFPEAEPALSAICDRFGCGVAGITLGEKGSLFLSDGKLIRTEAFPVPGGCVDTTGAGDAFRTGFIYGILTGGDVETCALYANAAASLKCRAVGARTALPSDKELQTMLKKY